MDIKLAYSELKLERPLALCRTENGKFTIFEDKMATKPVIALVNESGEAIEDPIVFYELTADKLMGIRRETKNNNVFFVFTTDCLRPIGMSTSKDVDWPISDMTIRDFAAIVMQKPMSLKKELNELIKSNK